MSERSPSASAPSGSRSRPAVRAAVPGRCTIEGPLPALTVLPGCVVAEPGGRPVASTDDAIAIGPEGGWSEAELGAARGIVTLGANILRVETAAIAAVALAASFHR